MLLAQAHEVSMVTIQGDEGNVMSVECTCVYGMFRDGHNAALACRARLPQRADREDQSQGASSIYVLCCEYSTSVSPPHTVQSDTTKCGESCAFPVLQSHSVHAIGGVSYLNDIAKCSAMARIASR